MQWIWFRTRAKKNCFMKILRIQITQKTQKKKKINKSFNQLI